MATEQMDGGRALIRALENEGVEVMFGLPGGAILPVYDPIIDSSIRHILVRHEQGAGHMAEGYAHATPSPSSRCGSLPGPPAAMIYELQTALQGHVLALGALSGTYTSIYMRTPNDGGDDGGGYDGPGDGGDI